MKIASVSLLNINNKNINISTSKKDSTPIPTSNTTELPNYQVSFGINLKSVETTILNGKHKLLKELAEIFQEEAKSARPAERIMDSYNKLRKMRYEDEKYEQLFRQASFFLYTRGRYNPQIAYEEAISLKKAANKLEKQKKKPKFVPVESQKPESPLDYKLLHRFATAIEDEKFNLRPIFIDHYSALTNIKTINELQKIYPKIKVPKNPVDVISDKYVETLTKAFYQTLDKMHGQNSTQEINSFIEQHVQQITAQIRNANKKLMPDSFDNVFKKIEKMTSNKIHTTYREIVKNGTLSSIPENKKIKIPKLTDNDIAFMSVDYNDFVLNIIRQQYLELKKPGDIVLHGIKVSSLNEFVYKFEKIPDKIRNIMIKSDKLHQTQRNYDDYTIDNLKTRLTFYADRIDNNENLLEKIIEFSGCKFEPEDIKMLKTFLKELDSLYDGEKDVTQVIENIEKQKLRPAGTERLNEIERRKAIEAIKIEQKKLATLTNKQETFDNAINLLYDNDLTETAEICAQYRPKTLADDEIETGNFIIKLIEKSRSKTNKNVIENPNKLETSIARWNTYYEYNTAHINDDVLQKAQKYAQTEDGTIDIDKAGKYIMNHEFVQNYPASIELSQNQELVRKIMEIFGDEHKFDAVKYLCKLDDYSDLPIETQSHINTITNLFDMKNNIDKTIIKHIIENIYTKIDTHNYLNINYSGQKKVQTTITAKAKQEIIDHYQFPKCLQYYKLFEEAMTKLAKTKATAGIKHLGCNNNTMTDVYELKIKGHDDRLLSYDGTYRFDTFDPVGLH